MKIEITLTDNEQELLDFMSNYDGPTGDELEPMLDAFKAEWFVIQHSVDCMLYFLSRIGLISVDLNASRSRFFVV